jgi:hypothetical protein
MIIVHCAGKFTWKYHFKKGRTSVCGEDRLGRASTSGTENNIQATGSMVRENTGNTVDDIAEAFYMFGLMKEALRGRFSFDNEVIGEVQNWLKTQPKKKKNFFSDN